MKRNLQNLSGYAWVVVALLWPVAMLNYLDRQMVSTVRASIRADIPTIINDQEFGTLMAVFMWVYAFLSPLGGFVADKFNRRWTVIGSLLVWSAVVRPGDVPAAARALRKVRPHRRGPGARWR